MLRKRWIGASLAVHLTLLAGFIAVSTLRVRGTPRPQAQAQPPQLIRLVEAPPQKPKPPKPQTPIVYPEARPTPRPTPPPEQQAQRPKPTPRPTIKPKELAEYRKLNPALRNEKDEQARKLIDRLKQLGLSPASASQVMQGVDRAILEGADRFYNPTTPGATTVAEFALPGGWATESTPLEQFLSRILPPDKGYEADLVVDAFGMSELRLRVRKEVNVANFEPRIFVERWNPGEAATPTVEVTVMRPEGAIERKFPMPLAPYQGTREAFLDQMVGLTMVYYQMSLASQKE